MPRKGEVPKREVLPDPKFTEQPDDVRRRITKFINTVMELGKKAVAEKIVYGAFDKVAERAKEDRFVAKIQVGERIGIQATGVGSQV